MTLDFNANTDDLAWARGIISDVKDATIYEIVSACDVIQTCSDDQKERKDAYGLKLIITSTSGTA